MQVFVARSSLTLAPDAPVPVLMYFEDAATFPPEALRPEWALLSVAPSAMQRSEFGSGLAPGWRAANQAQIARAEAKRRISEAFSDDAQRESLAELLRSLFAHGAAADKWPKAAQLRKTEIDRAWLYVAAVRRAGDGMAAGVMPADPTADNHWPTRITAYKAG